MFGIIMTSWSEDVDVLAAAERIARDPRENDAERSFDSGVRVGRG